LQLDSSVAGRSRKAFTIDLAVHLIGLAEQGRGDIADDQPGIGVVENIADLYSSRDSLFTAFSPLLTE
jgi:hypothetical protein